MSDDKYYTGSEFPVVRVEDRIAELENQIAISRDFFKYISKNIGAYCQWCDSNEVASNRALALLDKKEGRE